jgi:hypothetical protein
LQKYKNNADENAPEGFFSLQLSGGVPKPHRPPPPGSAVKMKKYIFSGKSGF